MEIEAAIERIKAVVGPRGWIDDPREQEPYLVEARRLYRGATRLVVRPASTAEVAAVVRICAEAEAADRAAGRQYRPRRRRRPARGRAQHRPRARPHEPHPRDRPGQFHDDRRGRLHPRASAAGGRRGRPAVPAEPRRRGQLPDRRQSLDQCRRHRGAALRQYARAELGPRGRAARRADLGRAARAAQGQHRLRPEAALHRRRRHARRHHRRDAEAVPEAARGRDRVSRRSPGSRT